MNTEITEEQIQCEFVHDENTVPIFDQDNWEYEEDNKTNTLKLIESQKQNHDDNEMLAKLDTELKYSKQGFFKVNVKKEKKTITSRSQLPALTNSSKVISSSKKIENLSSKNPKSILKQGYLQKKTDGIFFKWHTRYVALTTQKIFCFQNQHKEKVISCVNLKLLSAEVKQSGGNIILDFMGQCQNLIFKASNKKSHEQWRDWFEKTVNYQSRQKKMLLKTFIKPIYENKDSMTQRQFTNIAQTGDILLFHTKHTGAKLQRFITNSDYDHVAMVIKMKQRDIMVFESNQLYGVSIYDWSQYLRYFDLYQKVTLRKLNYVRKSQIHHSILNFGKKNLGKKYDINAMKLLKFESDFDWEKTKKLQEDEERGYFCSELMAKVYKSVGLIENKKSSGRYWPVDFSEKNEIQLKKGAWLGPEQSIIMNKHVKNVI